MRQTRFFLHIVDICIVCKETKKNNHCLLRKKHIGIDNKVSIFFLLFSVHITLEQDKDEEKNKSIMPINNDKKKQKKIYVIQFQ